MKLTLISAPAGFGKTTLLSNWLAASCEWRTAWLSLDEADNNLSRFLTYFISALQTIFPKLGEQVLTALQLSPPPPGQDLLTILLNEITANIDPFILVLDDYHVIDSEEIGQAMTFLLDNLPPQMHMVIATREDPPLPLARLRARSHMCEIRASDLRFTPAEAADFLNRVMGLNLSAEEIAALENRTEGWICGLQLAALSMQGRDDIAGFIRTFAGSHRFVLDYLVEEVLKRQPAPVRSFLLQTMILDRFCAPLCDAVTRREDGIQMLENLERRNLFLVALDDTRKWYRYHHLFSEILQTYLPEIPPNQLAEMHRRASAWFESNGFLPSAIRHALAAKDWERSAGLLELAWPEAESGSILPAEWFAWVKTLPATLIRRRPALSVWYAYALLGRGELEAAAACLKDAGDGLEAMVSIGAAPDESVVADAQQLRSLPVAVAVGHAYIAQALGNTAETVKHASRVLELAPDASSIRYGQACMLLGIAHWANGNLESAEQVFADYTMKLRAAGNIPDAISTTAVLADIRLALGRLQMAIESVEECLHFVIDQGETIPFQTADLHRELSELYLEQGDLETAGHYLQQGKELAEKAALPVLRYRLCIAQARYHKANADLEGALKLLEEAERLYFNSPLPDFCPISAMKARIWVKQGRLNKALKWVSEKNLSPDNDLSYLREFEHITLSRILIAQFQNDPVNGSIRTATQLLDRMLREAEKGGRTASVIELLVLQALAHQAQGEITFALPPLERALTLAEAEGFVRIFLDEGKPMAELLQRLGKNKSSFLKRQSNIPQSLIEPLSESELEVLKLLRSELSGPEIASTLRVALSTLRTHTQHIYAKLGVNHRRAAVRRAEELQLFK